MYQFREIHVSNLTNPSINLKEKSMYFFGQIQVTTWKRNPCNIFDKPNKTSIATSSDGVTDKAKKGNDWTGGRKNTIKFIGSTTTCCDPCGGFPINWEIMSIGIFPLSDIFQDILRAFQKSHQTPVLSQRRDSTFLRFFCPWLENITQYLTKFWWEYRSVFWIKTHWVKGPCVVWRPREGVGKKFVILATMIFMQFFCCVKDPCVVLRPREGICNFGKDDFDDGFGNDLMISNNNC